MLIEHRGPKLAWRDPDFQEPASGSPWTYGAMRTPAFLYVEYRDGERELYDLRRDPFELHNIARRLSPAQAAGLHSELLGLELCRGSRSCGAAMHAAPLRGL